MARRPLSNAYQLSKSGQSGGSKADQRNPFAVRVDGDIAQRLADHAVTKPVMLIELRVETRPITRGDRSDAQTTEPRVSHPPRVAPPRPVTPIRGQHPRSQTCRLDYEKALQ